jgi:lambda family phage portal protein
MGALQTIGNWFLGRANTPALRPRAGLEGGFGHGISFPYDAAQVSTAEMGEWFPQIHSPDYELDWNRDRIVARARDLYRNEGWARGAIGRILDSTIGSEYRLVSKPDYRALAWRHGKSFDALWAREFRQAAEAWWRAYANDIGHWNDVERQLTVSQQFRLALGHKLVDGESIMLSYWLEDRVGTGGAQYATAYQLVDPDRLANPQQLVDRKNLRGGVEIDERGVPVAYHFRKAEPFDWYNAIESITWERVPREDADGFIRVIHDYDRDRAGQHRGLSIFAPMMGPLKMLARYYGIELQAATVGSIFGTVITSPYDQEEVRQALDDAKSDPAGFNFYDNYLRGRREQFGYQNGLMLGGVRVPTLAQGEDIKSVNAARPHSNFTPFTHDMLRRFAAVLGISAEQVTQDYSEASWSSARAGIVEAEKSFLRRLGDFNTNTANPVYANALAEPYELGELPMPRGMRPDYLDIRSLLARCRWLGAPRGWVDPIAERQGAVLGLDAGFDTLENVTAGQQQDWEEVLDQRAAERARFKELGIPDPQWFGTTAAPNATSVAEKPEKPTARQPLNEAA